MHGFDEPIGIEGRNSPERVNERIKVVQPHSTHLAVHQELQTG
jgi:hypothetical protein